MAQVGASTVADDILEDRRPHSVPKQTLIVAEGHRVDGVRVSWHGEYLSLRLLACLFLVPKLTKTTNKVCSKKVKRIITRCNSPSQDFR